MAAVLVVLGFITNRLNVSITGQKSAAPSGPYIPKWTEIAVTGAIIAAGWPLNWRSSTCRFPRRRATHS